METLMAHTETEHEVMAALGHGNRDMEAALSAILWSLGIRPKRDGYRYLMAAVPLLAKDITQSLMKELYPAVAEACGAASVSAVDQSIGRAIREAWKQGDKQAWRRIIPADESGELTRPKNKDFMRRLAVLLYHMPGKIMEEIEMELNENNRLKQLLRETRQEAREDGIRQGKILATTAALRRLVQKMGMTPQEAMSLLEIPKKERRTYARILANRERQRQERAENNRSPY